MAQLAIKGHSTRGNEVIEILEMLGGRNVGYSGLGFQYYYYIDECDNIIGTTELPNSKTFIIYTLEKFLEKFPYKIRDKVIVKGYKQVFEILSMRWCSERNDIMYSVSNGWFYTEELQPYKEETKEKCDLINFNSHHIFDFADRVELVLKDDWEVKNEEGKTFVVRKQTQYPKTYEECCEVLGYEPDRQTVTGYDAELIENLQTLKLCRDAYWKIAGDWKAEFRFGKKKYCIMTKDNKVISATVEETNRVFVFPTEEMRDAFFENFKDLINQCKELL